MKITFGFNRYGNTHYVYNGHRMNADEILAEYRKLYGKTPDNKWHLELAKQKFEFILDAASYDRYLYPGGTRQCTLCQVYLHEDKDNECGFCPVKAWTGFDRCNGTSLENFLNVPELTEQEFITVAQWIIIEIEEIIDSLEKDVQ